MGRTKGKHSAVIVAQDRAKAAAKPAVKAAPQAKAEPAAKPAAHLADLIPEDDKKLKKRHPLRGFRLSCWSTMLLIGAFVSLPYFFYHVESVLEKDDVQLFADVPLLCDVASYAKVYAKQRKLAKELNQLAELPALSLATAGWTPNKPIVMIPGIVSTGLELWEGEPCAKAYFRERLWGSTSMMRSLLQDTKCWIRHMMLDPETGLDPPGVKLRGAHGLEAADYLVPGYWVWGKWIENLAALGYDSNSLVMQPYDWRLAPQQLEKRDGYFTKLKHTIELTVKVAQGRKAVIMSHSMGGNMFLTFMAWVESPTGGHGGSDWVARHIDNWINIAGPLLGVPKAVSSAISGEMRDTAQFNAVEAVLVNSFVSSVDRLSLLRSWLSVASMLPKGGNAIWGDKDTAPDDEFPGHSFGALVQMRAAERDDVDAAHLMDFLREVAPNYTRVVEGQYSYSEKTPLKTVLEKPGKFTPAAEWRGFSNPLEAPLPNAPGMKIFCMYGVGKPTERSYHYRKNIDGPESIPYVVDTSEHNETVGLRFGVQLADGDGTVPLISLGYMCIDGWKSPKLNPANMQIITREYKHAPLALVSLGEGMHLRGGKSTADHVDIMGNHDLLLDVIRLVAMQPTAQDPYTLDNRILSKIEEVATGVRSRL